MEHALCVKPRAVDIPGRQPELRFMKKKCAGKAGSAAGSNKAKAPAVALSADGEQWTEVFAISEPLEPHEYHIAGSPCFEGER